MPRVPTALLVAGSAALALHSIDGSDASVDCELNGAGDGECGAESGIALAGEEVTALLQQRVLREGAAEVVDVARHSEDDITPTPFRQSDLDFIAQLNGERGRAMMEEAMASKNKVPADWHGPARSPDPRSLWGGPSVETANAPIKIKTFKADRFPKRMHWATANDTDVPEGLRGIYWMDQAGFSSIAKDPSYPYLMSPSPEYLTSFGPSDQPFGMSYDPETRCMTPLELYGPGYWVAEGSAAGYADLHFHNRSKNTLSFCYTDDSMENIQIYQKMLTDEIYVGTTKIGPIMANLLGFMDAGHGYSWIPFNMLDMKMVKTPWGWDRVSTIYDFLNDINPLMEYFLWVVLPDWMWVLLKSAQGLQKKLVSHYPLILVIDENGEKTQYYDEFMDFLQTTPHPCYLSETRFVEE